MCEMCEAEFVQTMGLVRCAQSECQTPLSCLQQKKCVQIKAAVLISSGHTSRD